MAEQSSTEAEAEAISTNLRPLRVWPPVLLLGVMLATRYVPSWIDNGPAAIWMLAAFGPLLAGFMILVWWLTFSRASWLESLLGVFGVVLATILILVAVHPTMRGPATMVMTIPMGFAGFAIALILLSRMLSVQRTIIALLEAVLGMSYSLLLKSDGMWGNFAIGLTWRWQPTPEERFLASKREIGVTTIESYGAEQLDASLAHPEWPGFRGGERNSVQHGSQLQTDWTANPPQELWRVPVGPAWSSFAVAGKLLFTQEQRDDNEAVVCYDADTGSEVWSQEIEARFFDPLGGLGPRSTPTIADGSLFAMGATGWLMRLDARTGEVTWKVDLKEVAEREAPVWGFSSSPLVAEDVVVVHAGGEDDRGTLAFDMHTGKPRWQAPSGSDSYGSPQLANIGGRSAVVMLTNMGLELRGPDDGAPLLDYPWKHPGYRALQPQVVGGDRVLLPTGMGTGTRLVQLADSDEGLLAEEVWTSRNMKPDFNDFVVHQGYLYGFDDSIFACVSLEDGSRAWKGGRYGKGQVLLLADCDLLLVVSETGDVVLLQATAEKHQELARFQALEGKTWNHPVVIGDRLYVRNAAEAACFRLPVLETEAGL